MPGQPTQWPHKYAPHFPESKQRRSQRGLMSTRSDVKKYTLCSRHMVLIRLLTFLWPAITNLERSSIRSGSAVLKVTCEEKSRELRKIKSWTALCHNWSVTQLYLHSWIAWLCNVILRSFVWVCVWVCQWVCESVQVFGFFFFTLSPPPLCLSSRFKGSHG